MTSIADPARRAPRHAGTAMRVRGRAMFGLLVVLAASLALPGGSPRAETAAELPPDALRTTAEALAAAAPEAARLGSAWIALAEAGHHAELEAAIDAADDRPLASELALSRLVAHLQAHASGRSPGGQALLAALSTRTPRLWARHAETAGDWFLPVVAPGAEAAAALRQIRIEAARERWSVRLEADAASALAEIASAEDAARVAEVLMRAPRAMLERVRDARSSIAAGATSAPVRVALAKRMPDARLHREALAFADAADRLELVATAPQRLSRAAAEEVLLEATGHDDLASAAVLALGRLRGEPVQARLLAWLGDPRLGSSAAAALSQGDAAPASIERHATSSGHAPVLRDAALALRLRGTPEALQALSRLGADPRMPAAARAELQR